MLVRASAHGKTQLASKPSLAGLVVLAGSLYPIPSRTRPLNSPAPMVLSLKAWKSRSLPGQLKTEVRCQRSDVRRRKGLSDEPPIENTSSQYIPLPDRRRSPSAAVLYF